MEPKEWLREFQRLQSDIQKCTRSAERIGPNETKEYLRRFAQLKNALPMAAEWGPVLPGQSGELTKALILGLDGPTQYKRKRRVLLEVKEAFLELVERQKRKAGRPPGKLGPDTGKRILMAAAARKLGYTQSKMLPLIYQGYERKQDQEARRKALQKLLKRHSAAITGLVRSMSQERAKEIINSTL
jgi:hypothetical protein